MSYIPPHRRSSSSLPSVGNKNFNNKKQSSVAKWFPVGLAHASQLSTSTHLKPYTPQASEGSLGKNQHILVLNDSHASKEDGEGIRQLPWEYIAENVQKDLISSFERLKNEKVEDGIKEVKPKLVARFGKILFNGGHRDGIEVDVNNLTQRDRTFFTNVPSAYIDYMSTEVVAELKLDFQYEKEYYTVKLSDDTQPGLEISCKCTASKDHETLELLKAELRPARRFVADISCLVKELDLRLMLCAKKKSTEDLTADENIKLLISCATIDSEVKGGLRWPLGKRSSGDRYTVSGVWHVTTKIYGDSSMRLKVRQADRFVFKSSEGQKSEEVNLKMPGIASLLQEPTLESELVSKMLEDNLKLIWKYCLDASPKALRGAVPAHE